jgi:uncharacterized protein YkwD
MMPRHLRPLVVAAVVVWVAACRAADPPAPPDLKVSAEEQQVLDLTNQAREKEKLPPLRTNPVLFVVARGHSANMARQDVMEHVLDGKKPSDRVKDAGYRYTWMGENIAKTDGDTTANVFKGWMESKGHREHILSDHFDEIGIGIARNDKGNIYYTQVFASPKKSAP